MQRNLIRPILHILTDYRAGSSVSPDVCSWRHRGRPGSVNILISVTAVVPKHCLFFFFFFTVYQLILPDYSPENIRYVESAHWCIYKTNVLVFSLPVISHGRKLKGRQICQILLDVKLNEGPSKWLLQRLVRIEIKIITGQGKYRGQHSQSFI